MATASIMDIIQSELIKKGLDEFFDSDGNFVLYDNDFQFIKKAMKYDDDVAEIVTRMFFQGFTFENKTTDNLIKKLFVNRFLNREIGRQTVDLFSSQVVYTTLVNEDYIVEIVEHLTDYVKGKSTTETTGMNQSQNDTRTLLSSLPQNNVNLNVEDSVLNYGDTNNIARNKTSGNTDSSGESSQFNLENLLKTNGLLEQFFVKLDKHCFLQTW